MTWLGDLLGLNIRDDTDGDDVELPRRATWRVSGDVVVEDKPDEELTEVTFGAGAVSSTGHSGLSLIGRSASGTGAVADIASAADDTFLRRVGGALAWGGLTIGMVADGLLTGAKLAANAVTSAEFRQSAAVSVVGRSANSTGDVDDIAAGANDRLLARTGDALSFVQLTLGMIPDALITAAKLTGVLEMAYTSTVTSSRNIALTDAYKAMHVDSSGGAVVITFVQDSTVDIPTGQSGLIRWMTGGSQVSVAQGAGATVVSSGTELKLSRLGAQLYWEKTADNTYFISGEKMA